MFRRIWQELVALLRAPLSDFRTMFERRTTRCPLCGSTDSRPVAGEMSARQVLERLLRNPVWAAAQGVYGMPTIGKGEDGIQSLVDAKLPGFDPGDEKSPYHRCAKCEALLTRQFWNLSGDDFALTVTGGAEHGKTTWLLSALTPLSNDQYELVRAGERFQSSTEPYVEPLDLSLLRRYRTAVPYYLLGSTVMSNGRTYSVRTLDVKGESFKEENLAKTTDVIERHLRSRAGRGALLIVDRFVDPTNPDPLGASAPPASSPLVSYVARAFGSINVALRSSTIWKGIVWTFLDTARWRPATASWLSAYINDRRIADQLTALASVSELSNRSVAPFSALLSEKIINQITTAVHSASLQSDQGYGLIRLLFSLQLLYSAVAARSERGKLNYYQNGGQRLVDACRRLARELYRWWDMERGGAMANYLFDPNWHILPCGRVNDASVWSDQILLDVVVD